LIERSETNPWLTVHIAGELPSIGKQTIFVCKFSSAALFKTPAGAKIGNTNSRYKFSIGARKFVNDWNARSPAHHCAVGVGHVTENTDKFGKLLGVEVARVC
jgi:L-arabinose isomerase